MQVFKGSNFAEVYRDSLSYLYNSPQYTSNPRDMKVKESLQVALEFSDPINSMYSNNRRSSQFRYIAAEILWYFLGRDDVDFISKYASFWKHIQNEDGSINSSYGNLLFTKKNRFGQSQYEWAYDSLVKDKDTRQAVMHFNLPEHQHPKNKDFVCTMYGVFHIRDNKLHFSINMRSNDAILGTPTDVAFFTVLQQQMLSHLLPTYPDLQLGSYTHVMDSFHIYERHFNLVKDMIKDDFKPVMFPLLHDNLINSNGSQTSNIKLLEKYHMEDIMVSEDPIYTWIQNNMKDDKIVTI
jgi:thymidylate synthase